ncbi:C-5 cytosine-specific DNA methylase [Balamuthia mandrillaris]
MNESRKEPPGDEDEDEVPAAVVRAVEFYSGIGGLHYALMEALGKERAEVVAAYDMNLVANKIYAHNLGLVPKTRNLESVTAKELDKYKADLFLLSPPCQPYTRQGCQRGSEDPRARSFLHLIGLLPRLASPPDYLLVENVVGFEASTTRTVLVEQLTACGYGYQEFHLSPTHFGIPNQRLRYFLVARRKEKSFPEVPPFAAFAEQAEKEEEEKSKEQEEIAGEETAVLRPPRELSTCGRVDDYMQQDIEGEEKYEAFKIPDELVLRKGMLFDIVTRESKRSCCFTKAYARFVEGTGSVIQLADPSMHGTAGDPSSLLHLKLRYFTPREVANLHGFPREGFEFPAGVTLRQQYQVLGNSLNIGVVAELLRYLLSS